MANADETDADVELVAEVDDLPVPTVAQLNALSKITEDCLPEMLIIAFTLAHQLKDLEIGFDCEQFDCEQVEAVASALARMNQLREASETAVNSSVLAWIGQVQTKPILIGPNLYCRSRHAAVLRTSRNYLHWWVLARQKYHGEDKGITLKGLRKFFEYICEQKLFLTKTRVWQWGAKLKVEMANVRLLRKQLQPRLSFKERLVVDALRTSGKPMNAEDLLAAAKLSWTGSHKEILAGLDDRGVIIANRGAGYHLPEWYLSKSRTKSV
jgi:hypothetical protein